MTTKKDKFVFSNIKLYKNIDNETIYLKNVIFSHYDVLFKTCGHNKQCLFTAPHNHGDKGMARKVIS